MWGLVRLEAGNGSAEPTLALEMLDEAGVLCVRATGLLTRPSDNPTADSHERSGDESEQIYPVSVPSVIGKLQQLLNAKHNYAGPERR